MGSLVNNIMVVGAVLAALVAGGSCGPPKVPPGPNITTNYNGKWLTARATWYGQPNGAGAPDNGGACGIKNVNLPPYSGMTACGAIWRMDTAKALKGPFSIRLTSESGKKVIAKDVIPANWRPDAVYTSNVQFY
ncbi:beta expansin1 [Zea mays]|uniref:Beta expansin1 n=1 Tax=Zea mays TaxID=4577 RepID=A0A1D6P7B3_MAIZE|nr:beta expansin1 [Zea mays]